MSRHKTLFLYGMVFFVFIADRFLKWFFMHTSNFFLNDKIAFSVPIVWSPLFSLLTFFIVVIVLCVFFEEYKKKNTIRTCALCAIILGAVSNLWDRIFLRGVIDYIHFFNIGYFNLADTLIMASIVVLFIKKTKNIQITGFLLCWLLVTRYWLL